MRYRADIDGLRAIAVLSVVLYHLDFAHGPSGGFVGVDVFFVISGYLITGILQETVASRGLSLVEFYDRRVRRIFPAVFVVYAFCLGASALTLFPTQARAVGADVRASLAFVSNVTFYRLAGYFDQTSQNSLLLHTWSLSVEEQFYIFFPVTLFVLGKVSRRVRLLVLTALLLASLAGAVWMVRVEPPRAFYLVHYRAWELLLGALLAQGALPAIRRRATAEALGAIGVACVLASVFKIRQDTPFPGLAALPPTVGALLILYSGQNSETVAARCLGATPLRWVGLVSYSLYLWHWPLIALFRLKTGALTNAHRLAIIVLSAGAAAASYRWVESPIRRKPHRFGPRATLSIAAGGMATVAALAVGVPRAAAAFGSATSAEAVLSYLQYPVVKMLRTGTCFLTTGYNESKLYKKEECLALRADRKNFLVLGDSHAAHLWAGLSQARPDINFLQATASGCGAFIHLTGAPRCTTLFAFIFREFLPKHHLDGIVYHGRWTLSYERDILETAKFLRPFADRIIVIGPPVEYDEPLPKLLSRAIAEHDEALPHRHLVAKIPTTDRALADAVRSAGLEYYSMVAVACPKGECIEWAEPSVPLSYDYGHLTEAGSKLLSKRLAPAIFH